MLHDCAGRIAAKALAGRGCLTPSPTEGGVLTAGAQHDRMEVDHFRGYTACPDVQVSMNQCLIRGS